MKPKYTVGEIILYIGKKSYELGYVKLIIKHSPTGNIQQYNMFDEPVEDPNTFYQYGIQFSSDDRIHTVDESLLHKLSNIKNFTVLKRSSNDSINDNACRQLACEICERMDSLVLSKFGEPLFDDHTNEDEEGNPSTLGLISGAYYEIEDLITAILQGGQYE